MSLYPNLYGIIQIKPRLADRCSRATSVFFFQIFIVLRSKEPIRGRLDSHRVVFGKTVYNAREVKWQFKLPFVLILIQI